MTYREEYFEESSGPIPGPNDSVHFKERPFKFTTNRFHIDWRRLHAIDPDRVLRETDTALLESVVDVVAYGDIEAEDPMYLTELNFVKIFRVAQMIIDYLLWVQDTLNGHNEALAKERRALRKSLESARTKAKDHAGKLKHAKQQLKANKRHLQTYQVLALMGREGAGPNVNVTQQLVPQQQPIDISMADRSFGRASSSAPAAEWDASELRRRLEEAQDMIRKLQREREMLAERSRGLQDAALTVKEERDALEDRAAELEAELRALQRELDEERERSSRLEAELSRLRGRAPGGVGVNWQSFGRAVDEERARGERERAELEARVESLSQSREVLDTEVASLRADNADLRRQVEAQQATIERLRRQLREGASDKALADEMEKLLRENADLRARARAAGRDRSSDVSQYVKEVVREVVDESGRVLRRETTVQKSDSSKRHDRSDGDGPAAGDEAQGSPVQAAHETSRGSLRGEASLAQASPAQESEGGERTVEAEASLSFPQVAPAHAHDAAPPAPQIGPSRAERAAATSAQETPVQTEQQPPVRPATSESESPSVSWTSSIFTPAPRSSAGEFVAQEQARAVAKPEQSQEDRARWAALLPTHVRGHPLVLARRPHAAADLERMRPAAQQQALGDVDALLPQYIPGWDGSRPGITDAEYREASRLREQQLERQLNSQLTPDQRERFHFYRRALLAYLQGAQYRVADPQARPAPPLPSAPPTTATATTQPPVPAARPTQPATTRGQPPPAARAILQPISAPAAAPTQEEESEEDLMAPTRAPSAVFRAAARPGPAARPLELDAVRERMSELERRGSDLNQSTDSGIGGGPGGELTPREGGASPQARGPSLPVSRVGGESAGDTVVLASGAAAEGESSEVPQERVLSPQYSSPREKPTPDKRTGVTAVTATPPPARGENSLAEDDDEDDEFDYDDDFERDESDSLEDLLAEDSQQHPPPPPPPPPPSAPSATQPTLAKQSSFVSSAGSGARGEASVASLGKAQVSSGSVGRRDSASVGGWAAARQDSRGRVSQEASAASVGAARRDSRGRVSQEASAASAGVPRRGSSGRDVGGEIPIHAPPVAQQSEGNVDLSVSDSLGDTVDPVAAPPDAEGERDAGTLSSGSLDDTDAPPEVPVETVGAGRIAELDDLSGGSLSDMEI
ncbi:unnamed protein product [Pedinophyceae sp. YPF-701]|nr:unnamed protein product [Pedinophyceae sp. YPF-701]